jgi:hypothetical protein
VDIRKTGRARALRLAALAVVVATLVTTGLVRVDRVPAETETADTHSSSAMLIKHGWDMPQPWYVRDHAAEMEQRGFDGVIITYPSAGKVLSQTPVTYETLMAELGPLAEVSFTTMTNNFAIVFTGALGTYDGDWTVPVANMANLARAAREVGLVGIAYDNEEYGQLHTDWPRALGHLELPDARRVVHQRGVEVLGAIASEWPDATVMTFIGPWVSSASTADHLDAAMPYNDIAWANELLGPFFLGMVDAARDLPITIVDAGEVYTARSAEQFDVLHTWNDGGFLAVDGGDTELSPQEYADRVDVGFMVYDEPWIGADMNEQILTSTLKTAMDRTDRYVIVYTEAYDWWGVGWPFEAVPDSWSKAIDEVNATTS